MQKRKGKMSFEKICRILANQWEEEFNRQTADQIIKWVDNLRSETTRETVPAADKATMIERVIQITKERRMEKAGDGYIEANDRAFASLSAYMKRQSEQFRD